MEGTSTISIIINRATVATTTAIIITTTAIITTTTAIITTTITTTTTITATITTIMATTTISIMATIVTAAMVVLVKPVEAMRVGNKWEDMEEEEEEDDQVVVVINIMEVKMDMVKSIMAPGQSRVRDSTLGLGRRQDLDLNLFQVPRGPIIIIIIISTIITITTMAMAITIMGPNITAMQTTMVTRQQRAILDTMSRVDQEG